MNAAEARSRKGRKPGPAADRLAKAAALGVLEKKLGVPIKRHRDPGSVDNQMNFNQDGGKEKKKDLSVIVKSGF